MTSSEKSVVVSGLGRSFGDVQAVRGISFEVGRGEVVALLGPNGAGKTTTIDMLSTLTKPDRGTATIAGFNVVSDAPSVRRSIMLTGQQVALDDILTGRENLLLFGRLQGLSKSAARSRAEELLAEFDLEHAAERRVGTYSGGMRRRIDIACGLVVRPEVVFLDEPTTGLDPRSRQTIWDLVSSFKNLGISTLLTTQYLEEADALSDRIILIDHGEIIAEGTADQLKERTGGSYCEIVPRDLNDLPAVVKALGPLLPEQNRTALTTASDRIAMPAPHGPGTLVEALSLLNAANIELTDIALRRPSLDDVFLALTTDNSGSTSTGAQDESAMNGKPVDASGDTENRHVKAEPTAEHTQSWLSAHRKSVILLIACGIAAVIVSVLFLQRDSQRMEERSRLPSVVQVPEPHGSAPPAAPPSLPVAQPPAPAPVVVPSAAEAPPVVPPATRAQRPAVPPVQTAIPAHQAPITSAAAVSPPQAPVPSPAAAPPTQAPIAVPAGAVSPPQAPIGAPPAQGPGAPLPPEQLPPEQLPPGQLPPGQPPVDPAPPDSAQQVLSPLLGGLP